MDKIIPLEDDHAALQHQAELEQQEWEEYQTNDNWYDEQYEINE